MTFSTDLQILAAYLTGIFENREQAAAEPTWYVPLRVWQHPVKLFTEDSVTLFAEQANVIQLEHPYRQRLLRLQPSPTDSSSLQVQYYSFKNPERFKGAGQNPDLLELLTSEQIELLPGCILKVRVEKLAYGDRFIAIAPSEARCYFQYNGERRQVALGFEIDANEYLTHDKGIDPETGRAIWGAVMGPYRYQKISITDSGY